MKKNKLRLTSLILLAFLFFILSKWHIINNPDNDFGGLILSLTTLEIWETNNAASYNYCAVQTYNNPGDKHITYYKRLKDKYGNNYYVSFPPFAMIFAKLFIDATSLPIEAGNLRIFNLILHLATSVFIYLSLCCVLKNSLNYYHWFAYLGMLSFLFIPINLFTVTYSYFPEYFFWTLCIYCVLYIIYRKPQNNYIFLLTGFMILLLIYTEWIGLFFSISLCIASLLFYKEKIFRKLFFTTLLFTIVALTLTIIQYLSINNYIEVIRAFKIRYLERSGLFGTGYSDQGINILSASSLKIFFINLNNSLFGFGYLAIGLIIVYLSLNFKKLTIDKSTTFLIFLCVLPTIMHFILFFNSNAIHRASMAKVAIPAALLSGYFACKVYQKSGHKKLLMILLALLFLVNIIFSEKITKKHYQNFFNPSPLLQLADKIRNNTSCEESIFIEEKKYDNNFYIVYLSYFCKRNLMFAVSPEKALLLAQTSGQEKGVFIYLNNDFSFNKIVHFTTQSTKSKTYEF